MPASIALHDALVERPFELGELRVVKIALDYALHERRAGGDLEKRVPSTGRGAPVCEIMLTFKID